MSEQPPSSNPNDPQQPAVPPGPPLPPAATPPMPPPPPPAAPPAYAPQAPQPPAGGPVPPAYGAPTYPAPPAYGSPAYGSPAYAGAPGAPVGGYAPPSENSTKAIVALVLGIVGLLCCPLIAPIAAIIVGRGAVKEIDASQGAKTGRGMGTAGWILGVVSLVLTVLAIILFSVLAATGNCHDTSSNGTSSFHCGSSTDD